MRLTTATTDDIYHLTDFLHPLRREIIIAAGHTGTLPETGWLSREAVITRLQEIFTHKNSVVFIIRDENKICATAYAEDRGYMQLGGLYIAREYRNKGLGRMLLAKRLEHARLYAPVEVRAETAANNFAMQHLLADYGFIHTGDYQDSPFTNVWQRWQLDL